MGQADDDDVVTGRRTLTQSAYADDRHLRSRAAIFSYAQGPVDPFWRLSHVPWDGSQVVADVGCGSGYDLRQLVPAGRCRHAVGIDLSAGMLRPLAGLRDQGRLTLLQGDAQRLPLRDGSADVGLAMHMLYHVPDLPAAVGELRRVVAPGGTVLASTNSPGSLAEVNDVLAAAVARVVGRAVPVLPPMSFTTETGAAILGQAFSDVTRHDHAVQLAFPAAPPVLAYLASIREPVERTVGVPIRFDAVLEEVGARVEQVIREQGSFRATSRSGVFVCR
jgi:SAM-dependent methyltransferase